MVPVNLFYRRITPIRKLLLLYLATGGKLIEYTETGNPVSFITNVAKALKINAAFSPVQSGSGDPSPENIRPISGWNGVNAYRTGKNLLPCVMASSTVGRYTFTVSENGEVMVKANSAGTGSSNTFLYGHAVIPAGTYKINGISGGGATTYFLDFKKGSASGSRIKYITSGDNEMVLDEKTDVFCLIGIGTQGIPNENDSFTVSPMIRPVAIADDSFEKYSGQTVNVVFPATGKNLLPLKAYNGGSYNAAVGTQFTVTENTSVTKTDDSISIDVSSWQGISMLSEPLQPGAYHIHVEATSTNMRMTRYVLDEDFKVTRNLGNTGSGTSTTIDLNVTIAEGEKYIFIFLASSASGSVKFENPQIEEGSSATTYEPFTNTAYGGTLDLDTWILTVTHIHAAFLATGKNDNFMYTTLSTQSLPAIKGINAGVKCNRYRVVPNVSSSETLAVITVFANGIIRWVEPDYIDKTYQEFNSMMGENRVEIVYELATPLVFQLTPTQILSLIGDNNIWDDLNEDMTVKYLKKG